VERNAALRGEGDHGPLGYGPLVVERRRDLLAAEP
jgi:hypothetical protein